MKKYLIAAAVLIVLVAIILLLGQNPKNPEPMPPANPSLDSNPAVVSTDSPKANPNNAAVSSIIYTDDGFGPNPLTVKKGETVTFKNESSSDFWPASAMHPTHTAYGGTTLQEHCPDNLGIAFDACKGIPSGSSWSFKFEKTGSWNYHDHLNASRFGKVIVQ